MLGLGALGTALLLGAFEGGDEGCAGLGCGLAGIIILLSCCGGC